MLGEWFEVYPDDNVWYVLVSGTKRLGPFKEYAAAMSRVGQLAPVVQPVNPDGLVEDKRRRSMR
jgi:hypothetical protein